MAELEEEKAETAPFQEKEVTEYNVTKDSKEDPEDQRTRIRVLIIVIAVIVLVGVAFVLGYVVRLVVHRCGGDSGTSDNIENLIQEASENVSSSNIENQLRYFTKIPHTAGTEDSHKQALYMKDEWTNYGLDKVELVKYDILLSYPKKNVLPLARIVNSSNGDEVFRARQKEKTVDPKEDNDKVLPPFNAYSASGNVTGTLVFVNYGKAEDFEKLNQLGITVNGSIVIAKYGKIFRGNKAKYAREAGAIGLILYSDPKDYSPGVSTNDTYPKTWWLPSSGVQRGSIFMRSGDPLTQGYPSVEGMYRTPIKDAGLPEIPVYPISAADAKHFLKLLTKTRAPDDWQGNLNIDYYLTMSPSSLMEVNLNVQMELKTMPVYNVMGTMQGSVEPDRLVLFGNHRDAWAFGAVDPSSGTASLMETVRVIGRLRKDHGWRPRRTLVFLSWGAEEMGLLGSTEWAEDFANLLKSRAVAYMNVDISVQGNYTVRVRSSPLMYDTMYEATKKVMSPAGGSMYNEWRKRNPADKTNASLPKADKLANSGSDFAALYHEVGIPSIDFRYNYDTKKMKVSSYPVYHSIHDTFQWMANLVDRGFKYHKAITQLWVRFGLTLADSVLIPFNVSKFADVVRVDVASLKASEKQAFTDNGIDFEYLDGAVKNLSSAAREFHRKLSKIDINDTMAVRMANDKLLLFERSFINPEGLPGRPYKRHMIYAPSMYDSYAGTSFPGIVDAIYDAKKSKDQNQVKKSGDWNQVKKQISLVVYYIRSATKLIRTNSI